MESAIYQGWVTHHRRTPVPHQFRYRMFMVYLDLSELDKVFHGTCLWSTRRPAPARFAESDHFTTDGRDLAASIRQLVLEKTGRIVDGPIRLLTHLRYFGYIFNPVSFYYCFSKDGSDLPVIVAEVANTPWNERHMYVLGDATRVGEGADHRHRMQKVFHVSPFMPMDQEYEWSLSKPGRELRVHMRNLEKGAPIFDAVMSMERREIAPGYLNRLLLAHPFMTAKVIVGIYWNALKLKIKGVPFHVHPPATQPTTKEILHG